LGSRTLALLCLASLLLLSAAAPGASGRAHKPLKVTSKSDQARAKLDAKLQRLVEQGMNKKVYVFALRLVAGRGEHLTRSPDE